MKMLRQVGQGVLATCATKCEHAEAAVRPAVWRDTVRSTGGTPDLQCAQRKHAMDAKREPGGEPPAMRPLGACPARRPQAPARGGPPVSAPGLITASSAPS